MNRTTLYVASVALASCAGSALAQRAELSPHQLGRITAGAASTFEGNQAVGGTIAANGSIASINTNTTMDVGSSAQQDARALNLVNASESKIANALNVWDGRLTQARDFTEFNVDQTNTVLQTQLARSARLDSYQRDPNLYTSSLQMNESTSASTSHSDTNAMVDTTQQVGGQILGGGGGSAANDSGSGGSGPAEGFALGMPEVDVQVGKGIAGSGSIDIHVDAGLIDFGINTETNLDYGLSNKTESQLFDGGPKLTNNFQTSAHADNTIDVGLTVDLPEVDFNIAGSACFVIAGKCDANGIQDATLDTWAKGSTEDVSEARGAFALDSAAAEYVIVDDSSLEVVSNYTVKLADSAQMNVRALNMVNAAGGAVVNGVNVARTIAEGGAGAVPFNLVQTNVVTQRY